MQELGFVGAKIPCPYGPTEGDDGLARNVEAFKSARQSVGTDFPLMSGSICCLSVCLSVCLTPGSAFTQAGLLHGPDSPLRH